MKKRSHQRRFTRGAPLVGDDLHDWLRTRPSVYVAFGDRPLPCAVVGNWQYWRVMAVNFFRVEPITDEPARRRPW